MQGQDRITIRLEPGLVGRMDALLERRPELDSRSHLARLALAEYLDRVEETVPRVAVELPRAYLEFLDRLIKDGYFVDREQAVQHLVVDGLAQDRIKEMLEHRDAMGRAAGRLFPVELEKDD